MHATCTVQSTRGCIFVRVPNPTPPISWDVLLYAGTSAIICYLIALIGNFITKVPIVLGERIDQL